MFRKICSRPSSKATKRHRSPRRQAASANVDAMLVFPVPGVPVTRMELPR
jgi:hypothetical protein